LHQGPDPDLQCHMHKFLAQVMEKAQSLDPKRPLLCSVTEKEEDVPGKIVCCPSAASSNVMMFIFEYDDVQFKKADLLACLFHFVEAALKA